MNLPEKIKQIRKHKNLSQIQVSEVIGISQAAYAKIEKGETKSITIEIGKGIAKALDVSFNELFEVDSYKNENINKSEVDSYKKQIEEKTILIDLLIKEREIYKKATIGSIDRYYNSLIWQAEENITNAKSSKERMQLELHKSNLINNKQFMFDNFINIGFFSKTDIENYYKELQENYGSLKKIWIENYQKGTYSYLFDPLTGDLNLKE